MKPHVKEQVLDQGAKMSEDTTPTKQKKLTMKELNQLSGLSERNAAYNKAKRALRNAEKKLGPDHPDLCSKIHALAKLCFSYDLISECEKLYFRSIEIIEKTYGHDSLELVYPMRKLAFLYNCEYSFQRAEELISKAIAIEEMHKGVDDVGVASSLRSLANLKRYQGQWQEAEMLYFRCVAIFEKAYGSNDLEVGYIFNNLAWLYYKERMYAQALPAFKRALSILQVDPSDFESDLIACLSTGISSIECKRTDDGREEFHVAKEVGFYLMV